MGPIPYLLPQTLWGWGPGVHAEQALRGLMLPEVFAAPEQVLRGAVQASVLLSVTS